MEKSFYEKILKQLENPSRVQVVFMEWVKGIDGFGFETIMSKRNTNDTVDWFKANADALEKYISDNGLGWGYIFERDKSRNTDACIYMVIAKDVNAYPLFELTMNAPKNIEYTCFQRPFRKIPPVNYERKLSALEEALFEKSTDVFEVLEP